MGPKALQLSNVSMLVFPSFATVWHHDMHAWQQDGVRLVMTKEEKVVPCSDTPGTGQRARPILALRAGAGWDQRSDCAGIQGHARWAGMTDRLRAIGGLIWSVFLYQALSPILWNTRWLVYHFRLRRVTRRTLRRRSPCGICTSGGAASTKCCGAMTRWDDGSIVSRRRHDTSTSSTGLAAATPRDYHLSDMLHHEFFYQRVPLPPPAVHKSSHVFFNKNGEITAFITDGVLTEIDKPSTPKNSKTC
jgi:hypothetical protein